MIKVLEHGIRKITCPNCKAKLQYEQEDVREDIRTSEFDLNERYNYIFCPDCNYEIILTPVSR